MLKNQILKISNTNKKLLSNKFTCITCKYNFTSESEKRFKEVMNGMRPIVERFTGENEEKNFKEIKEKLKEDQRAKVELLVDKFVSLNQFQLELYEHLLSEHLISEKKLTQVDLNTDWIKLAKMGDKAVSVNPGYFEQQEFMAEFTAWLAKQPKVDLGLGLATAAAAPEKKVEKIEEKKEEEKKEKATYDVELSSFDAAKKIALIKEVRVFTSLGLKEAKELVEKAPTVLLRGVKKDDTEAIVKKLTESGAKITLK
jgi:ribosomal protein L7/L12